MAELQKLKNELLAKGAIADADVEKICRTLYPEGKLDKEVVDFLFSLRKEARSVCPTFDEFLLDAVKCHVLGSGFIGADQANWLRQRLFADRNIGERQKKVLRDLKQEASGVSSEFQKLCDEWL